MYAHTMQIHAHRQAGSYTNTLIVGKQAATHAHAVIVYLSQYTYTPEQAHTQPNSAREGEPTRETTRTAAQQYVIMLALNIPIV